VAFCGGRTLLPKTNFWLIDYAPIATGNECAKHALLSLATAYVLDYSQDEALLAKANQHYKTAVELLNKALREPSTQDIGKADGIVCAIMLLTIDDVNEHV
jgi:Fungal specific transcription factor domain